MLRPFPFNRQPLLHQGEIASLGISPLKIDAQNKVPRPRTNSLQINPLDLTQPSSHGFV